MGTKSYAILRWFSSNGIAVLRYEKRTLEHALKMSAEPVTLDRDTTDDAIYAAKSAAQQEGIDQIIFSFLDIV